MGGAGGEFSPARGAARRRTSAHSGDGDAGESHQLVAAVRTVLPIRAFRLAPRRPSEVARERRGACVPPANYPGPCDAQTALALALASVASRRRRQQGRGMRRFLRRSLARAALAVLVVMGVASCSGGGGGGAGGGP